MNAHSFRPLQMRCYLPTPLITAPAPVSAADEFQHALNIVATGVGIAAGEAAELALRNATEGDHAQGLLLSEAVPGWTSAQSDAINRLVVDGAESACCGGIVPRDENSVQMFFNSPTVLFLDGASNIDMAADQLRSFTTVAARGITSDDSMEIRTGPVMPYGFTVLGTLPIPAATNILDEWVWFACEATSSIYAVRIVATGDAAVDETTLRATPPSRAAEAGQFVDALSSDSSLPTQYEASPEAVLRSLDITIEDLQAYYHPATTGGGTTPAPARRFQRAAPIAAAADGDDDSGYATIEVDLWGISIFMSHAFVTDVKTGSGALAKIQKVIGDALKLVDLGSEVLKALGGPAAGIAAAVLDIKAAELSFMDRGQGVWVPITWLQLPLLPFPAMAAAWIHPFPAEWAPPRIIPSEAAMA